MLKGKRFKQEILKGVIYIITKYVMTMLCLPGLTFDIIWSIFINPYLTSDSDSDEEVNVVLIEEFGKQRIEETQKITNIIDSFNVKPADKQRVEEARNDVKETTTETIRFWHKVTSKTSRGRDSKETD